MRLPRQEYWNGYIFPWQGDLSHPDIKAESPALAGGFFSIESPKETQTDNWIVTITHGTKLEWKTNVIDDKQTQVWEGNLGKTTFRE